MDECLKKEFEVLVSRIERLRCWSKMRVKEIESESTKVYHRMEKWIFASIQAENKAVELLGNIVREAVEDKAKMQKSIELRNIDTIINDQYIYYEILPPPPFVPNNYSNYSRLWNFVSYATGRRGSIVIYLEVH